MTLLSIFNVQKKISLNVPELKYALLYGFLDTYCVISVLFHELQKLNHLK
jgi:hypothetical protein